MYIMLIMWEETHAGMVRICKRHTERPVQLAILNPVAVILDLIQLNKIVFVQCL